MTYPTYHPDNSFAIRAVADAIQALAEAVRDLRPVPKPEPKREGWVKVEDRMPPLYLQRSSAYLDVTIPVTCDDPED